MTDKLNLYQRLGELSDAEMSLMVLAAIEHLDTFQHKPLYTTKVAALHLKLKYFRLMSAADGKGE